MPATGGIPLRSGQSASGGPVPPYWRGSCDGSASCVRRSLACSGLPADTKSILARVRSSNHVRMTRLVRVRVRVKVLGGLGLGLGGLGLGLGGLGSGLGLG